MLEQLKKELKELLKGLGYNVVDNRRYLDRDNLSLMIRTQGENVIDTLDTRIEDITLVIDIFSKYAGEKEIIQTKENILNNIQHLRANNPHITFIQQRSLKILEDKSLGVLREHGVLIYQFILASGLEDVDETSSSTGD